MLGIWGRIQERRRLRQQDRIRRYRDADIVALRNAVKERDRILAEFKREHREKVAELEHTLTKRDQDLELRGFEIDAAVRQIAFYKQFVDARVAEQVRLIQAARQPGGEGLNL